MALEVLDYINLSLALLATIPMVIIFRQYLVTKFHDYLIFSAIFISSFLSFSINVLASITDLLILYKLHHIALNSIYFFIFLHAVRTNKVRTHSLRRYFGFIWYIILTVLILFWEKYEHPDTALTLFGNMSKNNISYDPLGAGLITDSGIVIYSTGYGILAEAYYIFAIAMLFVIYIRVKPVKPTMMIMRAKKFWIIASGLILLFWITHISWFPQYEYTKLLALVSLFFIAYIGIKIPEGILISQNQIIRAHTLYQKYKLFEMGESKHSNLENVIKYIESIPKSIFETSN